MKTKLLTLLFAIVANVSVLLAAYQDDATVIYSESFSTSQGNFTIENKELPSALSYVWKWRSAEYGMVASAYTGGTSYAAESWLISPSISLSGYSTATLSFSQAVNKGAPTNFKVKISTDNGSTWSDLSISQWPAGTNWTFVNTTASLDAYVGKNVKIAFCYISTTSLCPQWEIKAFCINAKNANSPSFVGFEANNNLGEQIYSEGLIKNKVNVTLKETDTENHKYSINLINGGTGSFTMGGVKFLYTNSEADKTAYKTYNTYIQPNGADREIHIPTVAGEIVKIYLMEACAEILVDGVLTDFVAGKNTVVAKGESIVIKNTNAKPKIAYILPLDKQQYNGTCGENVTWILSNGVLTISGTGTMLNYSEYAPWYKYREEIIQVIINEGVTNIGNQAFSGCEGLTSVTIPNSVTSIGEAAFLGCYGLTSVTINSNAIMSEYRMAVTFGKWVSEYVIGNDVKSIRNEAFSGCTDLTSVTIPNSVTSIGKSAFLECTSLPVENNLRYADTYLVEAVDKTLSSYTIKDVTRWIGDGAFEGCTGLSSISIPSNVTSIGDEAFMDCSGLKSVTIPNSVTSIGSNAFNGCSGLTSVTIGNSVTSIGYGAFEECRSLTSVTIGESVSDIDSKAFYACFNVTSVVWNAKNCNGYNFGSQVKSFIFGDKVEVIPGGICMDMYELTSIIIPNSVTSIGGGAFAGCTGLTSVTIPNSVTNIGSSAFYNCDQLGSITIPKSVTSIGYDAFYSCDRLWHVTINSSSLVANAGGWFCKNTFGRYVDFYTIGEGIKSIGNGFFYDCDVKWLTLPSSITSIDDMGFSCATYLEGVTCYATIPPSLEYACIYPKPYACLYVPAGSVDAYKAADGWKSFECIQPISAEQTETNTVKAEPTEYSVLVIWSAVIGAYSYELVIRDKKGNVICTLIFNAQGQLISIAFNAPARNNELEQTQVAGFAFTVTGLEPGTQYNYSITAKNASGATLKTETGTFVTKALEGLDQINQEQITKSQKLIKDNQVFILRGDKTYTVTGQEL